MMEASGYRIARASRALTMLAALPLAAVAAGPPLVAVAHAQQAIRDGDMLTGELRLVRTRHPNGTRIEAYQIVSAPRAMPSDDEFCEAGKGATTFHLFTMNDADKRKLAGRLGETITVKADELFCAQTAWHIGDVAVPKWSLAK
jgi:hypothetical protein